MATFEFVAAHFQMWILLGHPLEEDEGLMLE